MNEEYSRQSNWIVLTFDELFEKIPINKIKIKQKDYLPSGEVPVIDQGQSQIGGYTNDKSKTVKADLPVFVFGDHTKILKYINYRFAPGADGIKIISPTIFVDSKLVFYFSLFIIKDLPDKGYARHFQYFEKSAFPLPPLQEQHRIVEKLEELFSGLDAGIASLEKAKEQLKTYRQAVLKHAFEGKLTEKWREENKDKLEPAEKLLEKIKAERQKHYQTQLKEWQSAVKTWEATGKKGKKPEKPRKRKEIQLTDSYSADELPKIPDEWTKESLFFLSDDIFDGPFGSNLKTKDYVSAGVRVIRLENIGENEFFNHKKTYVTKEKYESIDKHSVFAGDIIFSSFISENIRNTVIPDYIKLAINKADCFCVRLNKNFIPKLISYFLGTRSVYKALVKSVHGATRPRINTTQLKNVVVPIISTEEQIKIVETIEAKFSIIENLEHSIENSLNKSRILRQSILKQAFEGKLVPQDPEDEPAEKLLERIKAEKEAFLKTQKQQKRQPAKKRGKAVEPTQSIIEILKARKKPMEAKEVWQNSKHKNDIEAFYAELKTIENQIEEIKKDKLSLLSLKNENQSS